MTDYVDMYGWTIYARRFSAPIREGFHFYGSWLGEAYVGPCNTAEEVWTEIGQIRAEIREDHWCSDGHVNVSRFADGSSRIVGEIECSLCAEIAR